MVTDIPPVNSHAKKRTGYPAQKPLALLRRFIEASTEPGDPVLDPFCGCATAPVAAEGLGRGWIGVDISPIAVRLVHERMRDELGGRARHDPDPHREGERGAIAPKPPDSPPWTASRKCSIAGCSLDRNRPVAPTLPRQGLADGKRFEDHAGSARPAGAEWTPGR